MKTVDHVGEICFLFKFTPTKAGLDCAIITVPMMAHNLKKNT